jgi:putative ABC transport system substrate-binding protein
MSAGAAGSLTATAIVAEINEGLRNNGMIEGRDYVLELRYAAGNYEQFPDMAREIAQAGVSVILVNTISAVRAAQRLTPPLPVVMISINDPVGTGLVASLARPGGHTTGMATLNDDLTPKMLEFQRMIVPKAKVVATLFNPANPTNPPMLDNLRAQAGAMGMSVLPVVLQPPEGLAAAFSMLASGQPMRFIFSRIRRIWIWAIASLHLTLNIGCRCLRPGRRLPNWAVSSPMEPRDGSSS